MNEEYSLEDRTYDMLRRTHCDELIIYKGHKKIGSIKVDIPPLYNRKKIKKIFFLSNKYFSSSIIAFLSAVIGSKLRFKSISLNISN